VLLFPDSRRPEKNWPHFRALTELLLRAHPDMRVAWAGNARATEPPTAGAGNFADLTGRTRIDELPALIGASDLIVANDSGPMHLAAAMGRRVLALFGPTDPKRFGPFPLDNPRHRVLRAPNGDLAALPPEVVAHAIAESTTQ
jgi:ADP-heptose:LPS heptosyltransferase